MTTQTEEALKMAIEALEISEQIQDYGLISFEKYGIKEDKDILKKYQKALNACKEALKPHPNCDEACMFQCEMERQHSQEQEPVAWMYETDSGAAIIKGHRDYIHTYEKETPLYTHPKEWQELSEKERFDIVQNCDWDNPYDIADAIEQALKEKNT